MAEDKNDAGAMRVDVELVRQLAALLDETNLTEIEVEDGDRKVRVARKAARSRRPCITRPRRPPHQRPAPARPGGRSRARAERRQRGQVADGRHRLSDPQSRSEAVHHGRAKGRGRRHAW